MTWAKLDDSFMHHPKFVALEEHFADDPASYMAAIGLWASALAYCSRYLTDGQVARGAMRRIFPGPLPQRLIDGLTDPSVDLWAETSAGWEVVDYLQHNDSAETVRHKRNVAADNGRKGGQAKAGSKPTPPSGPPSKPLSKPASNGLSEPASQPQSDSSTSPLNPIQSTQSTQSTPLVPTSVVERSSSSSGGPGDDDDGAFIDQALDVVGERNHLEERAAGNLRKPSRWAKHKAVCQENARANDDLREAARRLHRQHPGWTPEQVADHVNDPPENLAEVVPMMLPPECPRCPGRHRHWPDDGHIVADEDLLPELDDAERARLNHPAGGAL